MDGREASDQVSAIVIQLAVKGRRRVGEEKAHDSLERGKVSPCSFLRNFFPCVIGRKRVRSPLGHILQLEVMGEGSEGRR